MMIQRSSFLFLYSAAVFTLVSSANVGSARASSVTECRNIAFGNHLLLEAEQRESKGSIRDSKEFFRAHGITPDQFVAPETLEELASAIQSTRSPISILGAGFSMGGQVAPAMNGGTVIDLGRMDRIIELNIAEKRVRVEAGTTWRSLQKAIDRHGLAVKIMQSYADFSIGGSIGVNVHGRYVGYGPMSSSIRSLRLALADGTTVRVSRTEHPDLFHAAVGGYGSVGVIAEAELDLTENVNLSRSFVEFKRKPGDPFSAVVKDAAENIRQVVLVDPSAQLVNADIYPSFDRIRLITYHETNLPLTVTDRFQSPPSGIGRIASAALHSAEQLVGWVKSFRESVYEPYRLSRPKVVTRNWEASAYTSELKSLKDVYPQLQTVLPKSRRGSFLQEYFIPEQRLAEFADRMEFILSRHKVNFSNISIRHVPKSGDSYLNWAAQDSFALVMYYNQPFELGARSSLLVGEDWTRELIEAVLEVGGSYYLPYHTHATLEQFRRAYPQWIRQAQVRKKWDPDRKFTNLLIQKYIDLP